MENTAVAADQARVNRLPIVIGTMLVQIGVGSLYAWSIFNPAMSAHLGLAKTVAGKVVASPSVIFTFSLACLALSLGTLAVGPLLKKFGIRPVVLTAGVIFGAAIIISAFSSNVAMLWIFAGIILGGMNGIAYMATLSNVIKWFPEKTGLVSGISVACYGLGSFLFKYIDQEVASGNIVSGTISSATVVKTFIAWGIIAGILVVIGALMVKDAPENPSVSVASATDEALADKKNFNVGEMVRTPHAWFMFLALFSASLSMWFVGAGITTIGATKTGLDASVPAMADVVAFIALANMAGRFVFGALSDPLGRKPVFFITYIASLAVIVLTMVTPDGKMSLPVFYTVALVAASCFGGNITVFPTWVGDYFGLKNHSRNYSLIYQGFGLASLAGGMIFAKGNPLNPPAQGNLYGVLWTMAVLFAVSLVILIVIRPPKKR